MLSVGEPTRIEAQTNGEGAPLGTISRFPDVIGTFMGRDALSLAVHYLELQNDDTVLLPVYTCQEVLNTFVKNAKVIFYDVRPDLTIDPDEIRAKLNKNKIRMVMITNYFGFLQPFREEIKKICAEGDASLIEDCAHSLLTQGSGETGDLVIYSFRKILPISDGGGLKVNGRRHSPAIKFYPRLYSNAISVLIMTKSTFGIRTNKLSRARLTAHKEKVLPTASSTNKDGRVLPLSYFAESGMANLSFPEIAKRRRQDFEYWSRASKKKGSLVPVFDDLPQDVCPFGFPARVKNRELIESRARDAGVQLSVHWRLDPRLGSECRNSHNLSRQLLTLPLYPDLSEKTREIVTGVVFNG
jgi:perosamine synthetase